MNQELIDFFYNASENTSQRGIITALRHRRYTYGIPDISTIGERHFDTSHEIGDRLLEISITDDPEMINLTLHYIEQQFLINHHEKSCPFYIDAIFLQYPEVIDFLRNMYYSEEILSLGILGDNYTLDERTYNEISFFNEIFVKDSNVTSNNVITTNKPYQYVRGVNSNREDEIDFIIKEDLTDDDLSVFVEIVNNYRNDPVKQVNIRFYNPVLSCELIKRLDDAGLNPNIPVNILGYPLTENTVEYSILKDTKRPVNVTYVCCHDLLALYCREPFLVENLHRSELEPDGRTDLKTYLKILEFVKNFEDDTKDVTSNIEKAMLAYQYINENYTYAINAGENLTAGATRNVDQILDTNQIVCVGYANLLSILCRRVGVPMFTYSAPKHCMNIARIVDTDQDGKVILDKICTFDVTNDSSYFDSQGQKVEVHNEYAHFGVDPEKGLHERTLNFLNPATILSVTPESSVPLSFYSRSPFEDSYHSDYVAESFAYSMLRLMGYNINHEEFSFYDLVAELNAKNRIGDIPEEVIYSTARKIEKRKHPEMNDTEFERHMEDVNRSIASSLRYRELNHQYRPDAQVEVRIGNTFSNETNVITYKMNIPDHTTVDLDSIDTKPVTHTDFHNVPNGVIEPSIEPENIQGTGSTPEGETDTRRTPEPDNTEEQKPITPVENPVSPNIPTDNNVPQVPNTKEEALNIYESYVALYNDLINRYNDINNNLLTVGIPTLPESSELNSAINLEEEAKNHDQQLKDLRQALSKYRFDYHNIYHEFIFETNNYVLEEQSLDGRLEQFINLEDNIIDEAIDRLRFLITRREEARNNEVEIANINEEINTLIAFIESRNSFIGRRLIAESRINDIDITDILNERRTRTFERRKVIKNAKKGITPASTIVEEPEITTPGEITENQENIPENVIPGTPNNTDSPVTFNDDDFSNEYIAGTFIRKPRPRKVNETDEEYLAFLKNYYTYYFPEASKKTSTYRLTKPDIIQDLPINSIKEQIFNARGMTNEEIEESKHKLGF